MNFIGTDNFDEQVNLFLDKFPIDEEYIVWGVGKGFYDLINTTKNTLKIKYCVDSNSSLHGSNVEGYKVLLPNQLLQEDKEKTKIIITPASYTQIQIEESLKNMGFDETNYCLGYDLELIWNYYKYNKLVVPESCISITTACTIKCKNCTMYIPYYLNDKNKHFDWESIKENIDRLFETVDYINDLYLGTGEALLHPDLIKILEYLNNKFHNRYTIITINTNGTYIPQMEIINALRNYKCYIRISDYEATIGNRSKIPELIKCFEKSKIGYTITSKFGSQKDVSTLWSDLGSPFKSHGKNEQMKKELFRKCGYFSRFLYDGKIYACPPLCGAVMGGIYQADEGDFVDIMQEVDRTEILKLYLKVNKKGYVSFCDRCDGLGVIANANTVPAGEQID